METAYNQVFLGNMFSPGSEIEPETQIAHQCFNIIGLFIIMVDVKGKITFLNNRAKEVLGVYDDKIKGKDFIRNLVTKNEQKRIKSSLNEFLNNNDSESVNILYRLRASKSVERIIDAQTTKVFDPCDNLLGILVSGRDITDYKVRQENLQQDVNLYRAILNKLPAIDVFVFDQEMRFLLAEGTEMENFGLSQPDLEGKRLNDISSKKLKDKWTPFFQSVLKGEKVNAEYKLKNRHYLIKASPLIGSDERIHSGLAVVRNITEEKLSERILKKSRSDALRSGKTKTQFIARVSHEIRTPLNAIMGFTEQLLQTKLSARQSEYVKIIDNSADLLLSLVNDILVMSKIEASQLRFDKSPFRIRHATDYVYDALVMKAEKKDIDFDFEIDDHADKVLIGDCFRLQQVLINLLTNSIKFTNRGSVKLKCRVHDETHEKIGLKFEVIDTGIGISDKQLKKIFSQYTQINFGTGKRNEGIGLGLAICKNLIELQGGTLSVSSQQGVGTKFSFIIPYRKGKESDILPYDSADIDPSKLKGRKILLVDDDSVNLFLGKTILEKFNCSLDVATNGTEAVKKLDEKKYDLVLLDIYMPDISGIEVSKYLRNNKKDHGTRIIALTAQVLKDDILKYEEAGINDFLIKPFKESYLYNKICEVLQVGAEPFPLSKTEIILKSEINRGRYDLFDLRKMADNDEEFVSQTLKVFIENSEEAVRYFNQMLKEKNWKQIGEMAHKILPSYRHLHMNTVIPKLVEIKTRTLIDCDYRVVSKLVRETIAEIENLTDDLKNEISA